MAEEKKAQPAAAKKKAAKGNNLCFTMFPPQDVKWNANEMVYLVYQEEKCPDTGRLHIQGFVQLKNRTTYKRVKEILGAECHLEPMRGTAQQAADYCKKADSKVPGGRAFEGGELRVQGKRMDLDAAVASIKGGSSKWDLIDEGQIEVVARYPSFVESLTRHESELKAKAKLKRKLEASQLRQWQFDMDVELKKEPNDRKVLWVWEPTGNVGKSWFARWLVVNRDAIIMQPGRLQDMSYLWAQKQSNIVIFDCSRTLAPAEDAKYDPLTACYQLAEQLKNGMVQSTKYVPTMVISDAPHVLFLANFAPTYAVLSADRWDVIEIDENWNIKDADV